MKNVKTKTIYSMETFIHVSFLFDLQGLAFYPDVLTRPLALHYVQPFSEKL